MLRESAYTVYLIHPPIVVGWTMIFRISDLPPLVKFTMVAPLSVATCFMIAYVIIKIPYAKKIL